LPKEKNEGDVVQNKKPAASAVVEKSRDDKEKVDETPFAGANVVNAGKT
jgi:hypothetical protein